MPAHVVVVLVEQQAREAAVQALRAAAIDVAAFAEPIAALDAIRQDSRARLVVCQTDFGPDRLNGIALLRMLRHKQLLMTGKSSLLAVLCGRPDEREHIDETDVLCMTLDPPTIVAAVKTLLGPGGAVPLRMARNAIIWAGAPARPAGLPPPEHVILFNRKLLARAEHVRHESRLRVERSQVDRVLRCLSINRRGTWALGMAEWVAGSRPLPPGPRLPSSPATA